MMKSIRALALSMSAFAPGCVAQTAPRSTPQVRDAPARAPLVLPADFSLRVAKYVRGWGRNWPTFKVHGNLALYLRGESAYAQTWGLRDLAEGREHRLTDGFELGTLSVHLTQAATLALVRDGTLDLDSRAADHLEIPIEPAITVEHLLTMTSGLPSFTESVMFNPRDPRPPSVRAALLDCFAGAPLEFEPGTDFAPSLSNAIVLGLMIESITQTSYPEAVGQLVLEPMGMTHTRYGRIEGSSIGLAFDEAEHLEPVVDVHPEALGAAGAWTSTLGDLGRFYAALLSDHFGVELSRRIWGDNAQARPYGFVSHDLGGRSAYSWVGAFEGHAHSVLIVPSDALVAIHLGNTEVVPGSILTEAITSIAYDLPVSKRDESRAVPIDPSAFEDFAGRWSLSPADLRNITNAADPDTVAALRTIETRFDTTHGLTLHIEGRPAKRMHPVAPKRFFFKDRPQSTARILGTGTSASLLLERGGSALRFRRASSAS